MNWFSWLVSFRSLTRHKVFAILNIVGLAIGIAAFITLALFVRFERSFERWIPNSDQLYIVQDEWNRPGQPVRPSEYTMGGLLEQMQSDFSGLQGTRIRPTAATVLRDGNATEEGVMLVDRQFFDIIDVPVVRGAAREALADPSRILLSAHVAQRYFGDADPIGQTLNMVVNGETRAYTVAAIIADVPRNSDFELDMIARLIPEQLHSDNWNQWGSEQLQTVLRFATPDAAAQFARGLDAFVERHGRGDLGPNPTRTLRQSLLPVRERHLTTPGAKLTMTALGFVGLLALLVAMANYVNLATARSDLRAREIALRKVLGASRAALIRQLIGESLILTFLAALVGLGLAAAALPWVNQAGGLDLSIRLFGSDGVLLPLLLLVLAVGAAAGFYPAFVLSRMPAAAVLASAQSPTRGRSGKRLREALVIFQFTLSTVLIIGTVVLMMQTRHVRDADLGYSRDGLVLIHLESPALSRSERNAILAQLGALPEVSRVTLADSAPGEDGFRNSENFPVPGQPGDGPTLQHVTVAPAFFETYEARLLAGRMLGTDQRLDDAAGREPSEPLNIVVNRRAVQALGFARPEAALGRTIGGGRPRTIVGVIDDLRFYSPREELRATYYSLRSADLERPIAALRVRGNPQQVIERARGIWRAAAPTVPFEARTARENLDEYYRADTQSFRLFTGGAAIALLLGCMGLWGLASFTSSRRVREIGIRKVLGATSRDIVLLFTSQLLGPVLLSNLLAWPLAWWVARTWLASYDDRIALSPWFFAGPSLLILLVALLTVLFHALRMSRTRPGWALHYE